MASRKMDLYKKKGERVAGTINTATKHIQTMVNGGLCEEEMDNWNLVEITGYAGDEFDNKAKIKRLSDETKEAFLLATIEERLPGEDLNDFYNGINEVGRPIYLKDGLRFTLTSKGYDKDATIVGDIAVGNKAHYDTTAKKFVISDGSIGKYGSARYKFVVVANEMMLAGDFHDNAIRLMLLG